MTETHELLDNLKSTSPASEEQVCDIRRSCHDLDETARQVHDISARVMTIAEIWSTVGATQINVLCHVMILLSAADGHGRDERNIRAVSRRRYTYHPGTPQSPPHIRRDSYT